MYYVLVLGHRRWEVRTRVYNEGLKPLLLFEGLSPGNVIVTTSKRWAKPNLNFACAIFGADRSTRSPPSNSYWPWHPSGWKCRKKFYGEFRKRSLLTFLLTSAFVYLIQCRSFRALPVIQNGLWTLRPIRGCSSHAPWYQWNGTWVLEPLIGHSKKLELHGGTGTDRGRLPAAAVLERR